MSGSFVVKLRARAAKRSVRRYYYLKDHKLTVCNFFCAVILVAVITCWGQPQLVQGQKSSGAGGTSWTVFAPAGMGFRIEVPAKPLRNDTEYGDTDPKGYKLIRTYESSESSLAGRAFQIIVLVPSKTMQEENRGTNKIAGLEFTIGGDDARPISASNITVDGLQGKEFIYHLPDAERLSHRKGRIIDARRKLFVLIYATDSASGLESSDAARFFNSFKVR